MLKFENIRKAISEEKEKERENTKNFIQNGYIDTWPEEHRNDPDRGIERHSTPTRLEAYKAGKISREKAIELATVRALKQIDKQEATELEKIATIEKAGTLTSATITIEWKKSATWGNNPKATLRYSYTDNEGHENSNYMEGSSIGGCGYDKESTAAAEVLNKAPEALKPLYIAKEKAAETKSSHEVIGYGSGYGIKPYFEGGVGINCFRSIYEKLGYKWENTASGKTFDVYTIALK